MEQQERGLFSDEPKGAANTWAELGSASGYVRESVVRALVSHPQPGTLPLLLVRLNDWVPQVRLAADAAVRSLMRPEFLPEWISAIDAVAALQRAQRANHTAMLNEIARFLSRPDNLSKLAHPPKATGPYGRRYMFDLLWQTRSDVQHRAHLLEQALTGRDGMVAAMAFGRVEHLTSQALRRQLYRVACLSSFGQVRYLAVRWLVKQDDDATAELIPRVCLDPIASVRWWCQHWLRAKGEIASAIVQAVAVACDEHSAPKRRCVAMQFLKETKPETAHHISSSWLTSESAQLRRSAIAIGLSLAAFDEKDQWARKAFEDPSLRVQRLLLETEHRGVWAPTVEQVLTLCDSYPVAERLSRYRVLGELLDGWTRLHGLLRIWQHMDQTEFGVSLTEALNAWIGRSQSLRYRPDEAFALRLARCWSDVQAQVPERLRVSMNARLRAFGIEPLPPS